MELRLFDHVEKIYIDVVNDSLRKANDGTWYIQNGKLDTKFSGKVTISGKTYTIKNGKVM